MTYTLDWLLSRSLSAPPASPAEGDTYLVEATGTGAWAGEDGQIAQWQSSAWAFFAPYANRPAYVADESLQIVYDGSAWATDAVTDTRHGIVIGSPDAAPLIALDNAGNTYGTSVLLDHDPTALDADAAHFFFNCATFPGINEPASSRNDTVWTFGYNIDPNGARANTAEPALALHWENYYNQGGTDPNAAMEWHLQFSGTDGVVGRRPLSAFLYRDGSYCQLAWQFSLANIYDWSGTARAQFNFTNATTGDVNFPLETSLSFSVNNTATLQQDNAAGTGRVTLLYLDNTDTIVMGAQTQVLGNLTSVAGVFGSFFSPTSLTAPSLGMYGSAGELGFAVGGVEALHVGAAGIGIGTPTPDASLTINETGGATALAVPAYTGFHMLGNAATNHLFLMESYGASPLFQARVAAGTVASPAAVAANTSLFNFSALGYDGASFFIGGALNFFSDEAWSGTAHGSRWVMRAVPAGTTTPMDMFYGYGDGRWGATGARFDKSYSLQTPATGFSITIADACGVLILDPAGALAAGTIVMPAAPKDGQICKVSSSQSIAALTLSANTGQTLNGALIALPANGFAEYTYVAATTTWYRTG